MTNPKILCDICREITANCVCDICTDCGVKMARGEMSRALICTDCEHLETCGYCVAEYPYAKLKTNSEGDSICPECWNDSAHICWIDDSSCRECSG